MVEFAILWHTNRLWRTAGSIAYLKLPGRATHGVILGVGRRKGQEVTKAAREGSAEAARLRVRREVESVRPFDVAESQDRVDVLSWVDSGAEIFRTRKPDVPPKHLVSYFVLYDQGEQRILLVDHLLARLWVPPGGHVDPGEDPRAAVSREAREELGLDVSSHRTLGPEPMMLTVTTTVGATAGHLDVSLWYVCEGDSTRSIAPDPTEFREARWWALDEVQEANPERFDPELPRFIAKLIGYAT